MRGGRGGVKESEWKGVGTWHGDCAGVGMSAYTVGEGCKCMSQLVCWVICVRTHKQGFVVGHIGKGM
jgi:hypothetical protein